MADRGDDVSGSTGKVRLAVVGAGLIGKRHVAAISQSETATLAAIVDPDPESNNLAHELGVPCVDDLESFLRSGVTSDGLIIATPNHLHLEQALLAIEYGQACLIEKPLAPSASEAEEITVAAETANVAVLVGHHRRYHAATTRMQSLIQAGAIGKPVAAQVTWCLRKPDGYFAQGAWRTGGDGGPVWINLVHDVDLLRMFLGEIDEVHAFVGAPIRQNRVEEVATVNLRFENGALATCLVADNAPSPWHFEGASGENPNIAFTGENAFRVLGSRGSLEFPRLRLWHHEKDHMGWGDPMHVEHLNENADFANGIALGAQIDHFASVIKGNSRPRVSARDGSQNIRVIEAILASASSGAAVRLS